MSPLKQWGTVLQINNQKLKITKEKISAVISNYLKLLSSSNCYYCNIKQHKECCCLSFLKDDEPEKLAVVMTKTPYMIS